MSRDSPIDDAPLVDQAQRARRAARDDFRAFEVLVERYQERVLGNCRYLTGSQSDAEDLAQEVFVKAFSGLATFERRSSFKTAFASGSPWLRVPVLVRLPTAGVVRCPLLRLQPRLRRPGRRQTVFPWRIKVNHCLNFLQRSRRERFVAVDEPEVEQRPELHVDPAAPRNLETELDRELITRSLDAMPETLRVPLLLRDLDGFSYQEIADGLGLSLSAVKMRIKRGREDFRGRYAGAQDASEAGASS